MFSYINSDAHATFVPFLSYIIRGITVVPLLLLPLTMENNWRRMLLFTVQYLPLLEYERGIHVLLLSIFMLEMKGRWLHSAWLCQLSLVLYCMASLLITLYNDLRVNGSDIFAVFFYANCLVFVVHSITVIKTIPFLVFSTNSFIMRYLSQQQPFRQFPSLYWPPSPSSNLQQVHKWRTCNPSCCKVAGTTSS